MGNWRASRPKVEFWRKRRRLKVALLSTSAALLIATTLALESSGSLDRLELDTVDARFQARGTQGPPDDLVVVAIDDVSFGDFRLRFQDWPRTYHARVLHNLARAGAKAVIYDVQFTEPSQDPDADYALYEAAGAAHPVVFATTEVDERGGTGVFGGDAETSARNLRAIRAGVGQALLADDPDGTRRRLRYELEGLRSLSVVAAEKVTGKRILPRSHPGDGEWIDYAGPPGTIDAVSFSRVHDGSVDPDRLRGRVVVVGPTAPTLHDVHPTSAGGDRMSGAEIQANAFETARRGFQLRSASDVVSWMIVVAMGLIAPLLAVRLSPLLMLPIAAAVAAAFLALSQLLFNAGVIVLVVAPLLALVVTTGAALAIEYFTETRERRRLRGLFARFVPAKHVEELVELGDEALAAKKASTTVLFADLRNFTTSAEVLQPDEVLSLLNEYLSQMGQAIEGHGGTIVDYQGDGILAVFGAPVALDDHADRALYAAREMLTERLRSFNAWLAGQCAQPEFEGLPPTLARDGFEMGVGLSSGLVVAGNLGYEKRLAYAAIGDATNTAVRLEGMTKDSGHQLFVADATRSMLQGGWRGLEQHGNLPIRGRNAETMVWVPRKEWLAGTTPSAVAEPRTSGRRAG